MRKGTVLSIEHDVAIIFTDDCGLVRIPCRPDMAVGREILLPDLEAVTSVRRVSPRIHTWKPAMAAAILLIVITVGLWMGQSRWPTAAYARISVEVNPGIELVLNRHLEVSDVRYLDEEARQLAAGVTLEGLEWREAVERWAEVLVDQWPEKLERMLVAAFVSPRDEAFLGSLREMAGTGNPGALSGVDVRILYGTDPEIARLADRNNLSLGRQMILNQSRDSQLGWEVDAIAIAPLGDLVGLMPANPDPDQDPVMARLRVKATIQTSATESSTPSTSNNTNPTTGKTDGQTSGKTTVQSVSNSTTGAGTSGENVTSGSTGESTSSQTTGATTDKATTGNSTQTTQTSGPTTSPASSQSGPFNTEPGKTTQSAR